MNPNLPSTNVNYYRSALKRFLAFFISFLACLALNAQTIQKGIVIDAKSRQPLQGATVSVVGQPELSSVSDAAGAFQIRTNESLSTINVSYIGYKTMAYEVQPGKPLVAALQGDMVNLRDVVLSQGIGQQKFNSLAKVDLDLRPVKTTQELMRIVPGLFVAQHAGGGKAEQIFLRGFDCDHGTDIAVSVDGMPVNMVSHAHGQGYADAHFVIPETIKNIDYGTGPYYAQQGNLNTAGYVGFSTYDNISNNLIQVEAGRFNTIRLLTLADLLKKNKDRQSAYIAAEANYSDGPTINPQNFNRVNIFAKYNQAISNNTRLSLSVSGFKSKWDASGQIPERAVNNGTIDRFGSIDPSEGGNTERYNANLLITANLSNGYTLTNQLYYTRNIFNLYSNFTFFLNDPVNGDEINQGEKRHLVGYTSKLARQRFYTNTMVSTQYGIGFRYDATKNSFLSNVVKRRFLNYIKSGDINEGNFYAYVQKQLSLGKFLLDGGLRIDHLNFNYHDRLSSIQSPGRSRTIVSPKLNIQYTVDPTFQLYVKTGKGFHSNDSRVVVANRGKEILPAAYGADLGINLKPIKQVFINIAAYYLYLEQEFIYVGDEGIVEPGGKTRRYGLDVIARWQFTNALFANANLNLSKGRSIGEPKGADYIPLAPDLTSTGGIYYKKKTGLNGGLSYRFIKDRPANEDNSIIAKGYFILDGAINYTRPKYEVGLAFENLLNEKWNEAQFATQSRLLNEPASVDELNFTPGTPLFFRAKLAIFF
ncbi:TonB-dependent receptor [Segetibacter sp. 3557_3]|uniref:TonB-dependent receptor n=1 Tax=Segetibacter sp. 3557_3 TaxID=2547429 RepID=UPI001058AC68|nr:TonB-dependent receptor [Segetibacter sp. 3557_3]TDH28890.1 TonB-dependent receptor [Segetibacter sp. 3557_3]